MKKRVLGILLTLCIMLYHMPITAPAAEIKSKLPTLTVNQSKVAFAGHEWWVIGDGTSGVYPQSGHITLLSANADSDFKNVIFRNGQNTESQGYKKYSQYSWTYYYANNPDGSTWATPNEYMGSTLQQKMVSLANGIPVKEQAVISPRSLIGGGTYQNPSADGIAGPGAANQKLWALSEAEWNTINNATVQSYGNGDWWWLRSPDSDFGYKIRQSAIAGHMPSGVAHYDAEARPALCLNLSSVLFTSAASENGKGSATVGNNLISAEAPTGTVKFTMKHRGQTLTVGATPKQSAQTGTSLSFSYFGATTGANQYISCVLTDSTGAVKYYGKLADSSNAASGNLSIPLAGVSDGSYTLNIFSEEANADLYTDFCSEPVTMKVTVSGGNGTVSEFGGTLVHGHEWNETAWSSNTTHHWHECTAPGCPITDANQKDGYAEHTYKTEWLENNETHGHECSACGIKKDEATHTDDNKDHICDYCDKVLSQCSDDNKDHKCDYCSKVLSQCSDDNKDHMCDYCDSVLSQCADDNRDHKCDYCDKVLSQCSDDNKDHKCDYCDKVLSQCADDNKDHKCDYCSKVLSQCADDNKDHKCDYCDKVLSQCSDDNKDHKCDYCDKVLSQCSDDNKDHKCDYCDKVLSQCADDNKDHKCDYCGKILSRCTDGNKDHKCDYCGKILSQCDDDNKDHKCDYCGKILSQCDDGNKDHKCDYCGKILSVCTGGKATCKDKAKCEICNKEYGELNPKNHANLKHFPANAATKTTEGTIEYWYCDGCGKYFSDEDGAKEISKTDTITAKLKSNSQAPQTGDTNHLFPALALLFVSGGTVIGTTMIDRKKKHYE